MERILRLTVEAPDTGRTVGQLLRGRLGVSHRLLTMLKLREDGILLNGGPVFVTRTVAPGDVITLLLEEGGARSENVLPKPAANPPAVLYEDDDLLIVDKPAGMPVHPSKGHIDDSLANWAAWYYEQRGQRFTFRCVNRLDRGTSGVLAVAKNAYAHARLSDALRAGTLRKTYLAVACGAFDENEGAIALPIRRVPGQATIRREVSPLGAPAVTHYRVLRRAGGFTLLRVTTETGRTHQIRVHLSAVGHPLAGDFLYGTEDPDLIPRAALHASMLVLPHPLTGESLSFRVPLPADMLRLIRRAGVPAENA